MNWRKLWMIKKSHSENANETETYTDEDEITESNETITTKKSSKNVDASLIHKLSYKRLRGGYLKFSFLLLNSVAVVSF